MLRKIHKIYTQKCTHYTITTKILYNEHCLCNFGNYEKLLSFSSRLSDRCTNLFSWLLFVRLVLQIDVISVQHPSNNQQSPSISIHWADGYWSVQVIWRSPLYKWTPEQLVRAISVFAGEEIDSSGHELIQTQLAVVVGVNRFEWRRS